MQETETPTGNIPNNIGVISPQNGGLPQSSNNATPESKIISNSPSDPSVVKPIEPLVNGGVAPSQSHTSLNPLKVGGNCMLKKGGRKSQKQQGGRKSQKQQKGGRKSQKQQKQQQKQKQQGGRKSQKKQQKQQKQ